MSLDYKKRSTEEVTGPQHHYLGFTFTKIKKIDFLPGFNVIKVVQNGLRGVVRSSGRKICVVPI